MGADTADLLETRSPLAMAVTLEMLRRGRHLAWKTASPWSCTWTASGSSTATSSKACAP
jgi:hypothetical protein